MSATRRRKRAPVRVSLLLANVLYSLLAATVAWMVLRPVYASPRFDVVMLAGALIGVVAAAAPLLARWSGAVAVLIGAVLYFSVALTLVIPSALGSTSRLLSAGIDAVRSPVMGWKGLVTLPLPLGEYKATLVPPFALVALAVAAVVWLGTVSATRWALAALPAVAMVVVAIAVGPAARAESLASTPVGPLSREAAVGLVTLAASLVWFAWRAADERRRAMRKAFGTATLGQVVRAPFRVVTSLVSATAVVAVSLGLGVLVGAPLAAGQTRDVARSSIEPRLAVDAAVSPLVGYRNYFSDEQFDPTLFTVSSSGDLPDRIRLATLSYFDGDTFSVSPSEGAAALTFLRMPAPLEQGSGAEVKVTITVDRLTGLWVPVVGDVEAVVPGGPRAATLLDSFYFIDDIGTGIVATREGLAAGDAFTVSGIARAATGLAGAGMSPGSSSVDSSVIPESLRTWVDRQDVTRDGTGLAVLVDRLRARGFLTHVSSLASEPSSDWADALSGYSAVEAPAGHSFDRIDRLFTALNEREAQVGEGAEDIALVAAAGDDEQFAVAIALLSAELGFPSRVVLGAHLVDTDPHGWTEPICDEGRCTGENMSVWTEVKSQSGEWIAVDATPQHEHPIAPAVTNMREPEIPTVTDREHAEQIVADPSLKGTSSTEKQAEPDPNAGEVGIPRIVVYSTIGAGALLLLVGPFVVILLLKAARRSRRRKGGAVEAAHGGWDELVDAAVDAGARPPRHATRAETAASFGPVAASDLAILADRATFSWGASEPDLGARAWALLADARRELMTSMSAWARLRAKISMRSLRTRRDAGARSGGGSETGPAWRSAERGTTRRTSVGSTASRRRRKTGAPR
jgi:hypothetical protein